MYGTTIEHIVFDKKLQVLEHVAFDKNFMEEIFEDNNKKLKLKCFNFPITLNNLIHLEIQHVSYIELEYLKNLKSLIIYEYKSLEFPKMKKLESLKNYTKSSFKYNRFYQPQIVKMHGCDFPKLKRLETCEVILYDFTKLEYINIDTVKFKRCKFDNVKSIKIGRAFGKIFLKNNIEEVDIYFSDIRKITNPKYRIVNSIKIKNKNERYTYARNKYKHLIDHVMR